MNPIYSSIVLGHINLSNVCALHSEAMCNNLAEILAQLVEAYVVVSMGALIDCCRA